jgi:hypothetical protein
MTYIVFANTLSGFQHIPALNATTLREAIHNTNTSMPSQHCMYYIYHLDAENLPVIGTRFNVYKFSKAIAGPKVEKPHYDSHEYALTHNSSMAWFFTDDIFGN